MAPLLLLALLLTPASGALIQKSELPQNGNWVSLDRDVEFLRMLETDENSTIYDVSPFVEGESEYDEYQQAWRYLGFMIDCNDIVYDDDDGSWDGGTGEGCNRYLIWAAYVDLEYEGGGIGEYQYWDPDTGDWDTTPCNYGGDNNGGSSRCAKMDCHLDDTHWSLLGIFKHRSYDDWLEQLFKHEGFCVWDSESYYFMKNARQAWPQGCSDSGATQENGDYLYYDLKPTYGGNIDIALYTDTRCMEEYTGSLTVEDVLGNVFLDAGSGDGSQDNYDYDFSDYSLEQSLETWDEIFSTWKICHPCVAYDLNNVGYNADDDASRGSSYMTYNYGYDDDQYNNYEQSDFDCYDDADYTNVNQCMKFMAKTAMNTATFRDLSLASSQGTLVDSLALDGIANASGRRNTKSPTVTGIFFLISLIALATGVFMMYKVRKEVKDAPEFIRQPLVFA